MATMSNKAKAMSAKAQLDWDNAGATYRMALLGAGYTPNPDHNFMSSITNELTGTGYARKDLTGRTVTQNDVDDKAYCDANDPAWPAINAGTIKWGVIFKQVTNDADSPIITVLGLTNSGGTVVTNGGDFTWQFDPKGAFEIA